MTTIDRIAPTHRPAGRAAGTQRWRELLFVHWRVPADMLRAALPSGLELDTFDGDAFIGLVPFIMRGVKPWWAPAWTAFNFLETNVRTYVHAQDRPGVFFFSLEAASWIAVKVARLGWHLPYHFADMHTSRDNARVLYTTTRRGQPEATLHVEYTVGDALGPSKPGTLEHFLLERYLLFAARKQHLLVGQVHHTPYPAHTAHVHTLSDGLVAAAGFPDVTSHPPDLIHYAPGVDVEVFRLERLSL